MTYLKYQVDNIDNILKEFIQHLIQFSIQKLRQIGIHKKENLYRCKINCFT